MHDNDIPMMRIALEEAELALSEGEIPVGAVIARGGEIISRAHNTRERRKNALGHAECDAIDAACKALGTWRLSGCTMYVTLEPCPMCAGAIINARLDRVVFGAYDEKAGSLGSLIDLSKVDYNHHPRLRGGVLGEECAAILGRFFTLLRERGEDCGQ